MGACNLPLLILWVLPGLDHAGACDRTTTMQIPTLILAVAVEVYAALLLATLVLLWHSRKQKKLILRQQGKILELINAVKKNVSAPPSAPTKSYKQLLNEALDVTQSHFQQIASGQDITAIEITDLPLEQRITALRYAFLRAEELGTTETTGSDRYWELFQQTLAPLLAPAADTELQEQLETYKKRVENLEKFKKLFFDLEEQWKNAQDTAQDYYAQLALLAGEVNDKEHFTSLLDNYHHTYQGFDHHFVHTSSSLGEPRTIKIVRQDPRAAEEIIKLRNVAADQYRVINNLQRKLEEAKSDQEKALVVHELEQQLQRQMRFVQESDTCIQLLEEELASAKETIAQQEQQLENDQVITEENQRIKETLESFTLESKELVSNLSTLEQENEHLRSNLDQLGKQTTSDDIDDTQLRLQQIQTDFSSLQKQYADLEEKYLALKLK